MSVWEAMEMLNTLIDESDPDVRVPFAVISWYFLLNGHTASRLVFPKSSTFCKLLKPFGGMVSQNGCRYVVSFGYCHARHLIVHRSLVSFTTLANYFFCSDLKDNGTLLV